MEIVDNVVLAPANPLGEVDAEFVTSLHSTAVGNALAKDCVKEPLLPVEPIPQQSNSIFFAPDITSGISAYPVVPRLPAPTPARTRSDKPRFARPFFDVNTGVHFADGGWLPTFAFCKD